MKLKHFLFVLPLVCAGNAFSQINNQINGAQSADAWISGVFRANAGFEVMSIPGGGGLALYDTSSVSNLTNRLRWIVRGQNPTGGAPNAGYDFSILRRADNGVHIDIPFLIRRQTGEVVLAPGNGIVNLVNPAFNTITYSTGGIQEPTFTTRSPGTKAVWFPTATPASQVDFATGIESGHLWNSVPGNNASYGFKWYAGTTQIAELEGTGNFDAIGLLRLGPLTAGSERFSARWNALAFNRDVVNGAIFSAGAHAYQFSHAAVSTTGASDRLDLQVFAPNGTTVTATAFSVNGAGNIGIGIAPQSAYKMAVNGTLSARKVKITQETWADYVFQSGYRLPSIEETEKFIDTNKHLPGIPSEKEVKKEGIDVGEMNKLLLQKIEEQMLYIIEMNKEMKALKEEVKELKKNTK